MAIVGIESVVYGTVDVATAARFWRDFGLTQVVATDTRAEFSLAAGSRIVVCRDDDATLPERSFDGPGVREVCFGVDTAAALGALIANLASDRHVRIDAQEAAHFIADDGTPMALRVWQKQPVVSRPDPVNAAGCIQRFNLNRQWRRSAQPKTINHIVYFSDDYVASFEFMRDRLQFRLSDHIKGMGAFARASGTHEHHTLFWVATDSLPQAAGRKGCAHVAFGVDDIDEVMLGITQMAERGWLDKLGGWTVPNRHRVSSALYAYVPCPAGGDAEYHADTDYIDDNWLPRVWGLDFGSFLWTGRRRNVAPRDACAWDVALDPDGQSLNAYRKAVTRRS